MNELTNPTSWSWLWSLAGSSATATLAALILTALVNNFFPKLLDYRWAKRLEEAKSELSREANRLFKVHTKQFDVIPDLWAKANYAYGAIQNCAAPGLLVAISGQSRDDQIEIMKHEDYSQQQIERILASKNPAKDFQKEQTIRRFNRASKMLNEFSNEYFIQELFLTDDIAKEFNTMRTALSDVLHKAHMRQIGIEIGQVDSALSNDINSDLNKIKDSFASLKKPVAKYLGIYRA